MVQLRSGTATMLRGNTPATRGTTGTNVTRTRGTTGTNVPARNVTGTNVPAQGVTGTNVPTLQQTNTALIQFVNNPYQANFNLSDKVGAQLYIEATKSFSADKRIDVSQKNVTKFLDQMKSDARKFFWSPLINLVDTNITGNAKKQILEDFDPLSLNDVKKQAERIWSNPQASYDDPLPGSHYL